MDVSLAARLSEWRGIPSVRVTALHSGAISAALMVLVTCSACGDREKVALARDDGHEEEAPGAHEAGAPPSPAARGADASTPSVSMPSVSTGSTLTTGPDGGSRPLRDPDGGSSPVIADAGLTPEPDDVPAATEGNFFFLSSPAPPDGPSFKPYADTLSAYVPGSKPTSLIGEVSGLVVYLADPPNERSSSFLVGLDIWAEGGNQYIYSYDPVSMTTMNHGQWGGSPWGMQDRSVDAAVKLNDGRLVILAWDVRQEISRLWLVDATVEHDEGELVYESPDIRLGYHGVDASFRAVLSDGHNLLFLDEQGEVEVVASPDDELHAVKLSPFASGLLTVGQTGGTTTIRVYDDGWLQGSVSDSFESDSVAWLSASSLVYGIGEEVVAWNAVDGSEANVVTSAWEGRRPSGVSVPFGSGAALSAVLGGESSIVFSNGESTSFCGPSTAKIRALQPHVREGVAGVLFDETDPDDDTLFGEIYFCAPNETPVPLLAEHGLVGKLLAH